MYLVQHLHNSTRLYTCSAHNYRYEVAGRQGIVPAGGPFIVVLPGWRALSYFRRWSIRLPYLLVGFFIPCSTSQLTSSLQGLSRSFCSLLAGGTFIFSPLVRKTSVPAGWALNTLFNVAADVFHVTADVSLQVLSQLCSSWRFNFDACYDT